ncbi:hypothetical protein [Natronosalvus rutilus]|uniref:Uncharacterized protein n=1 Tax=Natronosalvus rutilus TaxID=2953753 RepID=A0A9E7N6U5_9EURY|nr:hypothetical protein [Natronosalvus rutilus]UTF52787.1 hypothetical protein NGM29_13470 [Natronosalvus rutilus]
MTYYYSSTALNPCKMDLLIQAVNETAGANSSNFESLADSIAWIPNWLRIAVTVLSGGLATYLVRQQVERKKLLRALKSEIRGMSGIETCKDTMNARGKPSASTEDYLKPKEMPPTESIPTLVFESNVDNIGLLKPNDIQKIVGFYTKVLNYKGIISSVRSGDSIPEVDQNELWDEIEDLADDRNSLFGEGWLDECSTENSRD